MKDIRDQLEILVFKKKHITQSYLADPLNTF